MDFSQTPMKTPNGINTIINVHLRLWEKARVYSANHDQNI